jgi:hypothetical protein
VGTGKKFFDRAGLSLEKIVLTRRAGLEYIFFRKYYVDNYQNAFRKPSEIHIS